jgi:hypothetical protein
MKRKTVECENSPASERKNLYQIPLTQKFYVREIIPASVARGVDHRKTVLTCAEK